MTYWALNALFLVVVLLLLFAAVFLRSQRAPRQRLSWPALGITAAVLLVIWLILLWMYRRKIVVRI